MNNLTIRKKIILERIDTIQKSLKKLESLKPLTFNEFTRDENFAIAEHYLRYALEATFDICAHILSRIPGVRAIEYREMAIEMGKQEIMPMEFAQQVLEKMAGYRNRLTHFYFEVTSEEMHGIIQHNLDDFNIFMGHIKKLLMR